MIETTIDAEIQKSVEELQVLQHFIWGVIGGNGSLICTETKMPLPGIKCKLLFEIKVVRTNKPVNIKDVHLPHVGDICKTTKGNTVKIVSID